MDEQQQMKDKKTNKLKAFLKMFAPSPEQPKMSELDKELMKDQVDRMGRPIQPKKKDE